MAFAAAACFLCSTTIGFPGEAQDVWHIDFRYSPPSWQTAICLPDDWQKTLVSKDGALLYDYPGKHAGFGTRISFQLDSKAEWIKQELVSPRVPIVRTIQQSGTIQIIQEAFAAAPLPAAPKRLPGLAVERIGDHAGQVGWAAPPSGTDPAFTDVAIGWKQPIRYHFRARRDTGYTVVFGLCEGYHERAGQRVLVLQAEGQAPRTVDLVAEKGRNQAEIFPFTARDENGDGWIDLSVSAATNSPDQNTILNTIWVFAESELPSRAQLISGKTTAPALAHIGCGEDLSPSKTPRHDLLLVRLRNSGESTVVFHPALVFETDAALKVDPARREVQLGATTEVTCSRPIENAPDTNSILRFAEASLPPHGEKTLAFEIVRGQGADCKPVDVARAESLRHEAERYWRSLKLPYDHLQIPDTGIQALVDSSIRNIYQAREIKNGLPAFQVGPTCYRGLWVVDGSFLLEAITYLGRANETRSGVEYLMSFQRPDGGFMLIDGHWKETGIALWAITRHAKLTGDKDWLRTVWPKVERGFAFIRSMRTMPAADALNARLIPDGFSDGGLADKVPEYTNIYWTLAGLRAAVEAARWLGQEVQAAEWQKEYDDFLQVFRRAAERDSRKDAAGNSYLPIRMGPDQSIPPQKAQWAFLHAIFPGKVFAPGDPLVRGNMAMLKSVEDQGLVFDTGWLKNGIWTYFGSFYGHAWLWLGNGDKAARTLYCFGNHASPLLAWREEQMPAGRGEQVVGDMPHNWASAEFIRLVRHSLVLERGGELHLFEAVPRAWMKPGAVIKATDIATEFGSVSLEFKVDHDGSSGRLSLTPPKRTPPTRIWLHRDGWSAEQGRVEIPSRGSTKTTVRLRSAVVK